MLWSKCDLKMHVRNLGYSIPLQIGGPKITFFRRFRNLTATLTAYIYGRKHDIHNRQELWKLRRVTYIVSKQHELWSTNGLKLNRSFYPPSVFSAFHLVARQTKLNQTLPHGGQSIALTICSREVGVVPSEKMGAIKPFTFVRFLDNFET